MTGKTKRDTGNSFHLVPLLRRQAWEWMETSDQNYDLVPKLKSCIDIMQFC